MQYRSTRGGGSPVSGARAVLTGLAPDGGLYLPESIPEFDWRGCVMNDTMTIAARILTAFLPDIPDMQGLVKQAYTGKFETDTLTPIVSVGDFSVLELFSSVNLY